ncbi:MAG: recombinase family protein [Candidatus Acetothermia bacterium]|nr:recombinase family protein [Candidatus Acetothermia bacterium]
MVPLDGRTPLPEALRKHCVERGHTIVGEFVDDGWSGTTDQRPGFQQMVDFALSHSDELNAILVWSYSRFSRDNLDALLYRDRLAKKGVAVVSISEPLATGPEAALTEGLLHAFNSYFPKVLARDVMRGMRQAARRGSYPLNTAPYGFSRVEKAEGRARRFTLVPKDDETALVKRIFREYVHEGHGAKEIADRLNGEGLRTRAGGAWSVNRVLSVLSNPIYVGTLHIKFSSPNARYLAPEDREVVIENWCEPVVDEATFAAAQTCRERRARTHPATPVLVLRLRHLLAFRPIGLPRADGP